MNEVPSRPPTGRWSNHRQLRRIAGIAVAYAVGSISFSDIIARRWLDTDLREVESGTVSATNVYRVGGGTPFVIALTLDIAKGAVALRGIRHHSQVDLPVRALFLIVGHNWSPLLKGAGGRGIAPAVGALMVTYWPGAAVLTTGVALGRLVSRTGTGAFIAQCMLVPSLARVGGRWGAVTGAALVVPMIGKRLVGNRCYSGRGSIRVYCSRLLHDRDEWPNS